MKVVTGFAVVGFLLPLGLLAYYFFSGDMAGEGMLRVCPSCIIMVALDRASTLTAVIAWLMICLSNAALYAFPAAVIAILLNFKKSTKPQPLFSKEEHTSPQSDNSRSHK